MEPNHYIIAFLGIITQLGWIIRTNIKEAGKNKRITILKDIDKLKINAIGNYEEKSKDKFIK
ncbi:hypothetical protein [uncultured Polaribacter sp.]|uniref:hypothetical protein n=1 Tax=uncultured Polaribacter sp. TaxID=174711 RepID=UPI00260BE016|nr:hypothetical protein [uncultured Polaribacter sp.]